MACFLVPTAEAIVTTIAKHAIEKNELQSHESENDSNLRFSEKLGWLNKMLWGGSGLLAFEHVWHGEISPFFPFLTAASNSGDTMEMLHEMATSGVGMAALVTIVWAGLVVVTGIIENQDVPDSDIGKATAK